MGVAPRAGAKLRPGDPGYDSASEDIFAEDDEPPQETRMVNFDVRQQPVRGPTRDNGRGPRRQR